MAVENNDPAQDQDQDTPKNDDVRPEMDASRVLDGSEGQETQADQILGDKNHLQRMMEGEAGEGEEEEEEGGDEAASLGALGTSIAVGDSDSVSADGEISFEDETMAAEKEAEEDGKEQIAEKSALDPSVTGKGDQGKSGGNIFSARGQGEESGDGAGSEDDGDEEGQEAAAQEEDDDDKEQESEEHDAAAAHGNEAQNPALLNPTAQANTGQASQQGSVVDSGAAGSVDGAATAEGAATVEAVEGGGAADAAAEAAAAEAAAAEEAAAAKEEAKAAKEEAKEQEDEDDEKAEEAAAAEEVVETEVYVEPVPQNITETFSFLKQGIISLSKAEGYIVNYSGGGVTQSLAANIADGVLTSKLSSAQAVQILDFTGDGTLNSSVANDIISLTKSAILTSVNAVTYSQFFATQSISLSSTEHIIDMTETGAFDDVLMVQVMGKAATQSQTYIVDNFMSVDKSGAVTDGLVSKTFSLWVSGKVSSNLFADILETFNAGTADASTLEITTELLKLSRITTGDAEAFYDIAAGNDVGLHAPADILEAVFNNMISIHDGTSLLLSLNTDGLPQTTVDMILNQAVTGYMDVNDAIILGYEASTTALSTNIVEELLDLNANDVIESSTTVLLVAQVNDGVLDVATATQVVDLATNASIDPLITGIILDLTANGNITAAESINFANTLITSGMSTDTIEDIFVSLEFAEISSDAADNLLRVEIMGEPYADAVDLMLAEIQVGNISDVDGADLLLAVAEIGVSSSFSQSIIDDVLNNGLDLDNAMRLIAEVDMGHITESQAETVFDAYEVGNLTNSDINSLLALQDAGEPYAGALSDFSDMLGSTAKSGAELLNTLVILNNPTVMDNTAQDIFSLHNDSLDTASIDEFALLVVNGDLSDTQAQTLFATVDPGEKYPGAFGEYLALIGDGHVTAQQGVDIFSIIHDPSVANAFAHDVVNALVNNTGGFDANLALKVAQAVVDTHVTSSQAESFVGELGGNLGASDFDVIVDTAIAGKIYPDIIQDVSVLVSGAADSAEVSDIVQLLTNVSDEVHFTSSEASTIMDWRMDNTFNLSDTLHISQLVIDNAGTPYAGFLEGLDAAIDSNLNYDAADALALYEFGYLGEVTPVQLQVLVDILPSAGNEATEAIVNLVEFGAFNAPLSVDASSFVNGMIDALNGAAIDSAVALQLSDIAAHTGQIDEAYLDDYLNAVVSNGGSVSYAAVLNDILAVSDAQLAQGQKLAFFESTFDPDVTMDDVQEILSYIDTGTLTADQGLSMLGNVADNNVEELTLNGSYDFTFNTPGGGGEFVTIETEDLVLGDDAIFRFESKTDIGADFYELRLYDDAHNMFEIINLPITGDWEETIVDLSAYSSYNMDYVEIYISSSNAQTSEIRGLEVYTSGVPLDIPANLSGYTLPEEIRQDEIYALSDIAASGISAAIVQNLIDDYNEHTLNPENLIAINDGLTSMNLDSSGLESILTFIDNHEALATSGLTSVSAIEASMPGLTYSVDTGNFYLHQSTSVLYDTALSNAASELLAGVNGHLVTVTSQEEHDFLVDVLPSNESWVWLAATDTGSEGTFVWEAGPEAGMVVTNEAWNGGLFTGNSITEDWVQLNLGGGAWDPYSNTAYSYVTEFEGDAVFASLHSSISNVALGNVLIEAVSHGELNQSTALEVIDMVEHYGLNANTAHEFFESDISNYHLTNFINMVTIGTITAVVAVSMMDKVVAGEIDAETFNYMMDYIDMNPGSEAIVETVVNFVDLDATANGEMVNELFGSEGVTHHYAQVEGDTLEEIVTIVESTDLTAEEVTHVVEKMTETYHIGGYTLDSLVTQVQQAKLTQQEAADLLKLMASDGIEDEAVQDLIWLVESNNIDGAGFSEFLSFIEGGNFSGNRLLQIMDAYMVDPATGFALKDVVANGSASNDAMADFADLIWDAYIGNSQINRFGALIEGGEITLNDAGSIVEKIAAGDMHSYSLQLLMDMHQYNVSAQAFVENLIHNIALDEVTADAVSVYTDLANMGGDFVAIANNLRDLDAADGLDSHLLLKFAQEVLNDWNLGSVGLTDLVNHVGNGDILLKTAVKMMHKLNTGHYTATDVQSLIAEATNATSTAAEIEVAVGPLYAPNTTIGNWIETLTDVSVRNNIEAQIYDTGLHDLYTFQVLMDATVDDVVKTEMLLDLAGGNIDPFAFQNLIFMNDAAMLPDVAFEQLISLEATSALSYDSVHTLTQMVGAYQIESTELDGLLSAVTANTMTEEGIMELAGLVADNSYMDTDNLTFLNYFETGDLDEALTLDLFKAVDEYGIDSSALSNITDAYVNGELSYSTFQTTLQMIGNGDLDGHIYYQVDYLVSNATINPAQGVLFLDMIAEGSISSVAANDIINMVPHNITQAGFNDFIDAMDAGTIDRAMATDLADLVNYGTLSSSGFEQVFKLIDDDGKITADSVTDLLQEVSEGDIMDTSAESLFAELDSGNISQKATEYVIETISEGHTDQGELDNLLANLNADINTALEALADGDDVEIQGGWTQTVKDIVSDFASIDDPLAAELPDPDGSLYALEIPDENMDEIVGSVF